MRGSVPFSPPREVYVAEGIGSLHRRRSVQGTKPPWYGWSAADPDACPAPPMLLALQPASEIAHRAPAVLTSADHRRKVAVARIDADPVSRRFFFCEP